jgi:site-specific DNA-methyltransferase (adenine-specific)
LIRRLIEVTTLPGDLVWEPFGGTCPTAHVCLDLKRACESAERDRTFYDLAHAAVEEHKAALSIMNFD